MQESGVTLALPKGRLLPESFALLERAGLGFAPEEGGRRLVYQDASRGLRYLICRAADVPTFVEYGAADLGIVGKDVILEQDRDVCELLDLGFGECRFVVAAPAALVEQGLFREGLSGYLARCGRLRVATKFPRVAEAFLRSQGLPGEVIKLSGNIELAPLVGLAEVIVDLVSTGRTLRENNLVPVAEVARATARLVANRVSLRLKAHLLVPIVESLRQARERSKSDGPDREEQG